MTLNEVKELVSKADKSHGLSELVLDINFPHINFKQQLKGAVAIYEFLSRQAEGWDTLQKQLPAQLEASRNRFKYSLDELETFLKEANSHHSYKWSQIKRNLENENGRFLIYDCPEVEFLIQVFNQVPEYYRGAHDFVIGNLSGNGQTRNDLIGRNLAYEFYMKDKSGIGERKTAEKASIARIRNDFSERLAESETHITGYIKKTDDAFRGYAAQIDALKNEKENKFNEWFNHKQTEFNEWFNNSRTAFGEFDTGSTTKIKDLEKIYAELLRLKMPAEYWRNRADVLKKEGKGFMKWIITIVLLGCITLYLLLWLTPEGMLLSFTKNQASAIKWSIIYITFISLIAFGIRTLAKAMFSAYHLARDAEEREQLAYLYLSLIKDSAVDDKDRNMVLQALFSRAETGLLKDESGPTMPSGILDKVLSK